VPTRLRYLLPALAVAVGLFAGDARGLPDDWSEPPAFTPSINDWGEHGLLQVPTARFGADGDFNFTFSHIHPYDRYNVYMTPLPWLEAGFRYTSVTNRPYGPAAFSGNQTYKDRSFDLRLHLSQESGGFPATALGIRDIAGTGLFSSEYLVASRRVYDFDISWGLGWGLMSSGVPLPNMFGGLSKSLKQRSQSNGAGGFTFDYFHGRKMGFFGGIEYHTPIKGLRLKLELDPDNYRNEPLGNQFTVRSPVNVGVVYDPVSFVELSAGLERGNTVMLRISLLANFNSLGLYHDATKPPKLVPRADPEPPVGRPLADSTLPRVAPAANAAGPLRGVDLPAMPAPGPATVQRDAAAGLDRLYAGARSLGYEIADLSIDGDSALLTVEPPPHRAAGGRDALERLAVADLPGIARARIAAPEIAPDDQAAFAQQIFADLHAIDFTGENFALAGRHAYLTFSQSKYRLLPVAIGRAARIVAQHAPPDVELITLDLVENGVTMLSTTLQRRDLERAVADAGSPEEVWQHTTLSGGDPDRPPGIVNQDAYPNYLWRLNPAMRQQLGGPDNFLIYQMYAALSGTLNLAPGLSFDGSLGANLFNNLNALHLVSDSVLPHVRSDIAQYLKQGKTGIFRLQSDYLVNLAPDLYGRISGGLLEEMFAGVDGEVLYRPYDRRWAIGLDLNYVAQRGFDELFALRPYRVATGHVSFYYKLPFYSLQAAVHVGRYLARDKGATLEVSREFAGGIRAGVFVTRTNVSAQQFGEGSFDKGFMLSIPLDLLLGEPSRTYGTYVYRPLTRDGGQRLDIAKPLYDATDGYDAERLSHMWPHLLE
jgi:hypothetical protein